MYANEAEKNQNGKYIKIQEKKSIVKSLKAKDTKANKLIKEAIEKKTSDLFKANEKNAFKLKEFTKVESKVKVMRS